MWRTRSGPPISSTGSTCRRKSARSTRRAAPRITPAWSKARSTPSPSRKPRAPRPGVSPFGTTATRVEGGFRLKGRKIFASLSGAADYYGVLCTEAKPDAKASRRDTMFVAVPADAKGVSIVGDWDPLGMRGTVSRTLLLDDVLVPEDAQLMPRGIYIQAATRWPHMFMTLTGTYLGLMQAAYDFTIRYLRGEVPGIPVKRRMYPTKQIAVAEMLVKLETAWAIWLRAVAEAQARPLGRGAGAGARLPIYRDGELQRGLPSRHPHLRGPVDAEIAAARAPLPRQPLRLADAALDGRDLHGPARARGALSEGRDG